MPCFPAEHGRFDQRVVGQKIRKRARAVSGDFLTLVEFDIGAGDETNAWIAIEDLDSLRKEVRSKAVIRVETADISAAAGPNAVVPGGGHSLVRLPKDLRLRPLEMFQQQVCVVV